ncbi:MAG: SAM-dependent methyltransferase [Bacilli bacterium]|nr:SAM-dependent methyltransferase [Bacilli bacterium]
MKISKRLKAISNFIEDNSNVIDVGCDHALLDIYLFNNKKNIKLIASDIKEGPLEQAQKNIKKYGCNIKVKLGYGISTIEEDIDTIVIAGMGGDTIVDILDEDKDKLNNVKTIVISPQSEWKKTRKFINDLGFYISSEQIIEDNNKFYLIIKFVKGNKKYSNKELEYGPILLQQKSKEFIKYYNIVLEEKINILKKIPILKIKKRIDNKNQIKSIRKTLKSE